MSCPSYWAAPGLTPTCRPSRAGSVLLLLFTYKVNYKSSIHIEEWPLLLSPIVTMWVASMVFSDFMIDRFHVPDSSNLNSNDEDVTVAKITFMFGVLVFFVCLRLSVSHGFDWYEL